MKRLRYWLLSSCLLVLPALANAGVLQTFDHPDGDLSIHYLNSIFGVVGSVLSGTSTQIMGKMFAVYNAGALSLGGIIVMYVLLSSTLNTAQDGEIMGKRWSSIWIPIRTALGVGLLLPQSTGYSFIQVFVMWVVVQGVGLGDHIWDAALNYLSNGGVIISQSYNPTMSGHSNQAKAAGNLFKDQVCVSLLQAYLNQDRMNAIKNGSNNIPPPVPPLTHSFDPMTAPNIGSATADSTVDIPTVASTNYYKDLNGVCGSATWKGAAGKEFSRGSYLSYSAGNIFSRNAYTGGSSYTPQERIKIGRASALQQMILNFAGPARQVAQNYLKPAGDASKYDIGHCVQGKTCNQDGWNNGQPSVLKGELVQHTNAAYQGILLPIMSSLFNDNQASTGWTRSAANSGWILAGAWYYHLSQANNNVMQVSDRNTPDIRIAPKSKSSDFCASSNHITDFLTQQQCLNIFNLASYDSPQPADGTSFNNDDTVQNYLNSAIAYHLPFTHGNRFRISTTQGGVSIAGSILRFIPLVGPMIALGVDFGQLSDAGSTNSNPLVLISSVGADVLDTVTQIWLITGVIAFVVATSLGAIPCTTISSGVLALVNWMAPFLAAITTMMFIAGVVLAYYVPLIPFIIFTFAAIGWMIGVIEAIVAAPIVALGVIHPEGHELWGKADQAIMILMNVFLRPGMMVIGLIAGIGLSYVGIWLLNTGVSHGIRNTVHPGFGLLWWPAAMACMYGTLCVSVVQKAFTLIHVLPDKVLRWLSGGLQESLGSESAGEALGQAKNTMSGAGSQVGGALTSGTGAGIKGMFTDDKDQPSSQTRGVDKGEDGEVQSGGEAPSMSGRGGSSGGGDGAGTSGSS